MTESFETASDLVLKEILINISDDDQFVRACSTNKRMANLCKEPNIWRERLKLYYPRVVEGWKPLSSIMNIADYYIIASLITKQATSDLADKIYSLDIDPILILNDNFMQLFPLSNKTSFIKSVINLLLIKSIQNENIEKTKELMDKFMDNRRNIMFLLSKYATIPFLSQILSSNEILSFYEENVQHWTNEKSINFIEYFKSIFDEYFNMDNSFFITTFIRTLDTHNYRTLNWLVDNTSYLDHRKIFTSMLVRGDADLNLLLAFMKNKNIRPNFEKILPVRSLLNREAMTEYNPDIEETYEMLTIGEGDEDETEEEYNMYVWSNGYIIDGETPRLPLIINMSILLGIGPDPSILN